MLDLPTHAAGQIVKHFCVQAGGSAWLFQVPPRAVELAGQLLQATSLQRDVGVDAAHLRNKIFDARQGRLVNARVVVLPQHLFNIVQVLQ